MSSINPYYTIRYSQPSGYHFSHDSVFLARFVFEQMKVAAFRPQNVLDLCAGCGIVGLDFAFHIQSEDNFLPKTCDFLEVQEIYRDHFSVNLAEFKNAMARKAINTADCGFNFICANYENFERSKSEQGYDLILCNPPYFQMGSGKLSSNSFKNRCRFFLDSTEGALFEFIERNLKPQGMAFVLSKKPSLAKIPQKLQAQVVGEVRGTPVLQLLA